MERVGTWQWALLLVVFKQLKTNMACSWKKVLIDVHHFTVPMLIVNMAAGWVSMLHNAKGPNTCTVTACATSSHSIGDAYRIIERGEADIMFAGGSEAPIAALGDGRLCFSSHTQYAQ
jgi:3-oxoacyl-(acyl-carrier-protein) synthase